MSGFIGSWLLMGQCGAPPGGEGGSGGSVLLIGYMVIFIALFYVMVLMPQRRKEKERNALIAATKTGDKIIFGGGIIGTVTNVKEKTLVVKVGDNSKMEILRGAVQRVLGKDEAPGDAKDN